MMENAKLRVTAFTMQVERTVRLLVEVDSPLHEVVNCLGGVSHDVLHSVGVGNPVASHHGVVYVFVEIVYREVGDRCYSALCFGGVGLVERGLADDGDRTLMSVGNFEGKAHTGYATADNEEIVMIYHVLLRICSSNGKGTDFIWYIYQEISSLFVTLQ